VNKNAGNMVLFVTEAFSGGELLAGVKFYNAK
jgi:hypothetical protein